VGDEEAFKKGWGIDEVAAGVRDLGDEGNPDLGTFPRHALDELTKDEAEFWLAVERVRQGGAFQPVAGAMDIFDQLELDLESARGHLAAGEVDPATVGDTKRRAAAIAQAGAEIALALVGHTGQHSQSS
jgi:hypothetical protein